MHGKGIDTGSHPTTSNCSKLKKNVTDITSHTNNDNNCPKFCTIKNYHGSIIYSLIAFSNRDHHILRMASQRENAFQKTFCKTQ